MIKLTTETGARSSCQPARIGTDSTEYCCHFPDRDAALRSITARLPYFMAMNLLRVARNDYICNDYGEKLIRRSKRLLQAC